MPRRCLAMLSRGLDGAIAARMMQLQGIEVEGFHYATPISQSEAGAQRWAKQLGIPLTVVKTDDSYFDLVRHPKFPRGEGANPCVDCRIVTFVAARSHMESVGADFVVSGEILGQRPLGQKRLDLEIIARHSGLDDRLLRPLSAKRLDPTLPERQGWVDREQLCDFVGASRKGVIELARRFGWKELSPPGNCCKLADREYSVKVFDLLKRPPFGEHIQFDLLSVGRHFRINADTKLIVARTREEAAQLEVTHDWNSTLRMALLRWKSFHTHVGLAVGDAPADLDSVTLEPSVVRIAATILIQQTRKDVPLPLSVSVVQDVFENNYSVEVTQDMVDNTYCRPIGGGPASP
jgi:tRNA-specific 2-thiouridylase